MAGVRSDMTNVVHVPMLVPVSTATLGVESGTFDCRSYPNGSRFLAVFNSGIMTEGTLTLSVVDCDTSGGTYTPTTEVYGTLAANTAATTAAGLTQTQAFKPVAGRPFIKLKSVETVSVTTAVPVAFSIVVIPPAMA